MHFLRSCLLALSLQLVSAPSALAETFTLFVTVHGLPDEPFRARLSFLLEGDPPPGFSDFATMSDDRRDGNRHFRFEVRNLEFPGRGDEGIVWGTVLRPDGTVAYLIPVTLFTEAEIAANDRRNLFLKVRARPPGWEAFRESYPMFLPDRGMFTDQNVGFMLEVFRTLVDEEFVGDEQWQRIYEKFLENIDFFAEGSSENFGRILQFLEGRYRTDLVAAERQLHFVRFYARFLNQILERDIGGRPAPQNGTLEDYAMLRLRTLIERDPEVVLPVALDAVAWMYRKGNWRNCSGVSAGMLSALAARGDALAGNAVPVSDVKVLLKRAVDCLQLHYTLEATEPGRSSGDLIGGAAFAMATDGIEPALMSDFVRVYEAIESGGHLPAREADGPFRQVYVYYAAIRIM